MYWSGLHSFLEFNDVQSSLSTRCVKEKKQTKTYTNAIL